MKGRSSRPEGVTETEMLGYTESLLPPKEDLFYRLALCLGKTHFSTATLIILIEEIVLPEVFCLLFVFVLYMKKPEYRTW